MENGKWEMAKEGCSLQGQGWDSNTADDDDDEMSGPVAKLVSGVSQKWPQIKKEMPAILNK